MKFAIGLILVALMSVPADAGLFGRLRHRIHRHHPQPQQCDNGACVQAPGVHVQAPGVRVDVAPRGTVPPRIAVLMQDPTICADERAAYQAADEQATQAVVQRQSARNDAEAATAAVAEAEAVLAAAKESQNAAAAALAAANQSVTDSTAAAGTAYQAWLDCLNSN